MLMELLNQKALLRCMKFHPLSQTENPFMKLFERNNFFVFRTSDL